MMALFMALVSLVGCGSPALFTATAVPSATPVAPMTAQTVPASPTAVPSPASPCPAPNPDLPLPHPDGPLAFPDDYADFIGNYLSAGGVSVDALLFENEWMPPRGKASVSADLDGDGWTERAVTFIDPHSEFFPPLSALALYHCADGAFSRLALWMEEGFTVGLVGAVDLTGDGPAELVFFDETCGASTCWDTPHIWHWQDGQFVDLMPPHTEYPSAEITLEGREMVVVSYGLGSVGAGPQRVITETWAWTGDAMTITSRTQAPPACLFHLFADGDAALRARDYDAAFAAFQRLIHEGDDLATASQSYSDVEERAWFTALAHWRLLTLDLLTGNFPAANREYTWLTGIAVGSPAWPVGQVARRFWESYRQSGNLAYACLEVDNDEQLIAPLLTFLNDFGYAAPSYRPQDICPFLDPAEGAGGTS